jgi:hypothetical protein
VTRRDYIKFAELIKSINATLPDSVEQRRLVQQITTGIVNIFNNDNKRFNREKFYRACEPNEK